MSGGFKAVAGPLLGLLVLVLLLIVFFETFEQATVEIEAGFSGEARANPYLASTRMLERLGLQTRGVKNLYELDELPPADGTVFLPVPRGALGQRRVERLREWVEDGGHLLVVGRPGRQCREAPHRDPLLDPLGVKTESPCDKKTSLFGESDEAESEGEKDPSDTTDDTDGPAVLGGLGTRNDAPGSVTLPGRDTPLQVNDEPGIWGRELTGPEGKALWAVPGRKGQRILQYRVGTGLLTVLSSSAFMTNPQVGQHDHAELVWRLFTWDGRQGPLFLVHGHQMPSLISLVFSHGWAVVLSLGLLLVLWLWSRAARFGPVRPLPLPARRSLLEHVEASGRLLWRHGHGVALLEAARGAVLKRAVRRIPQWQRLSEAERHERLAVLCNLRVAEVSQVLNDGAPANRAGFLGAIQRLERIRKAL